MSESTTPTGGTDGAASKLDKLKDPTSKVTDAAVDKLTNRKEGDNAVAGAAKDITGGAAKGAIEGAKKGGLHGAAAGAAAGAAKAVTKNKAARTYVIASVSFILLPLVMMGIGLLGMLNMTASHVTEMQLEAQGQEASGIEGDTASVLREVADRNSVPWPVIFALYNVQNTNNNTVVVAPSQDGGGVKPLASPGTPGQLDLGAGCDPWTTKVAQYLHTHWGANENGAGTIGCQRDENDSDHNSGNALDYMIVPHTETAYAKEVATFLMMNAKALSIKYLIFEQHIWNPERDNYGKWREMKSRGSLTADHYDHIHISFQHPGKDGDKTAAVPGTFAFPATKPDVPAAEIEKAFGGNGSGGKVEGYDSTTPDASGVSSDLPFGLSDDAEGLPKPDEKATESDKLRAYGDFLATKLKDALRENNFRGEDIGTGLAIDSDGKVVLNTSSEAERKVIEDIYVKSFMALPVDGASNEQWARGVWKMAIAYRMGQKFDVCTTSVSMETSMGDPNASGSPSATPTGSATPSATPSTSTTPSVSPSPSAPASPGSSPTAVTPSIPANVKIPFTVEPSSPYKGASSTKEHQVTIDARVLKNVAIVAAVAKELFPDKAQYDRAMVIAVSAMMVETGGLNHASPDVPESLQYPHDGTSADHDSVGIFQQRVYAGYYGNAEQLMDPAYQAYMFFGAPKPLHGPLPADVAKRGLLQYGKPRTDISGVSLGKNWMTEPVGEVTQTIQGSAFPDRYEKWATVVPRVIEAATGISVDINNPGGCIAGMDTIGGGGSLGVKPASGKVVSPIPDTEKGIIMTAKYGHYPSGGKHFGVDLARGNPWQVQAICDGKIIAIRINQRYANSNAEGVSGSTNYIWQDCGNGVYVGYAHFYARELNSDLKEGMVIGSGTPLFPQGNQGNSTGGHLHLQISTSGSTAYNRDVTVDPAAYLAQFGISLPKPGY